MKRVFTILLILLGISSLHAQTKPLPVYVLINDTSQFQEIDSHFWQVLDDASGNLTIQDVLHEPFSQRFYAVQPEDSKDSGRASAHWISFRIKNGMSRPADICFSTKSQQADFYLFENGQQVAHLVTGRGYPWHKKDGLKRANAVAWTIPGEKEILVYQRRYNERPDKLTVETKIRLYNTEKLRTSEFREYEDKYIEKPAIYTSFISGLLLLACIFNFLLFWQLKDRASLYFSLMLFCFFFFYNSFLREIVGRENLIAERLFNTFGISFIIFFLLFVREYFEVFKTHPRWNKFIVGYSVILAVLLHLDYVIPNSELRDKMFGARALVILGYLITIAITVIISFLAPGKKRKIFAIAILPFIIAVVSIILFFWILYAIHPSNEPPDLLNWLPYILGFFMVWATIVFSSYLYKNYGNAQRQVVEAMLEREKMALEQEQHRYAFMEKAKIQLEMEVESRTAELKASLQELKATQSQLIHAEKMASLGELTAGIAHEIQNPLNFVNNFSEVNAELITELKAELEKGNIEEAKLVAGDIADNEHKISQHGKRADSIVKGMLQHSRVSTSTREPTDINKLADEYLRLAYHGLRAKDKSFNTALHTHFDETIGMVNMIPQDISRVLLNLFSNSFYAVQEKMKTGLPGFEPAVIVSTEKIGPSLVVTVEDNGNGISQKMIDKIFQPFFTTKPAGQGTGLGLSLSYDIIKAHGGELTVDSKEGKYAKFCISLPLV